MAVNLEDILRELQGIKSALSKSNTSSSGGFANSYFGGPEYFMCEPCEQQALEYGAN